MIDLDYFYNALDDLYSQIFLEYQNLLSDQRKLNNLLNKCKVLLNSDKPLKKNKMLIERFNALTKSIEITKENLKSLNFDLNLTLDDIEIMQNAKYEEIIHPKKQETVKKQNTIENNVLIFKNMEKQ